MATSRLPIPVPASSGRAATKAVVIVPCLNLAAMVSARAARARMFWLKPETVSRAVSRAKRKNSPSAISNNGPMATTTSGQCALSARADARGSGPGAVGEGGGGEAGGGGEGFIALRARDSNAGDGPAVSAGAVQINQNVARLGAFAGADDAAIFEFVHNAGSARIAEAQAPLQEGDTGFLFAADDIDTLLDEGFVLFGAALGLEGGDGPGELFVDFQFVARFSLTPDEIDDRLDLLVGDEHALGANQFGRAGRQIKHVAFAQEFIGAHGVEN